MLIMVVMGIKSMVVIAAMITEWDEKRGDRGDLSIEVCVEG